MIKQITHWLFIGFFASVLLLTAPLAVAEDNEKAWTVNIRNAEIQDFIEKVADMTGKNFVVEPRVRARDGTVVFRHPLSAAEDYAVVFAVLQVHGYAAVPSRDVIIVVHKLHTHESDVATNA